MPLTRPSAFWGGGKFLSGEGRWLSIRAARNAVSSSVTGLTTAMTRLRSGIAMALKIVSHRLTKVSLPVRQ